MKHLATCHPGHSWPTMNGVYRVICACPCHSRWMTLADHLPDIPDGDRRCTQCNRLDEEHWSDPIEVVMVEMDGALHLREVHPT